MEKNTPKNPIRTLSGVTPIAILTKPYPCPGHCAFCPTEEGMPKSYLSLEPAAQRAKLSEFDPVKQVEYRLRQYHLTNHPTDKIELIILGGTWSYYPKQYQTWFIKKCLDTFNRKTSSSIKAAQKFNETAKHRVVGITIETRPDYVTREEVKRLRLLGVTRVELGVQTVYNDVLKLNLRGHSIQQTIKAIALLKQAGFKINAHIMPNLPGSSFQKDVQMFETLFQTPDFQPDMLKIYPCVLLPNTLAYVWHQKEKYSPYDTEKLIDLIIELKKRVPQYVRIMRLYRDIPKEYILAGSLHSNLRQIVEEKMKQEKIQCQCLRCREIRNQENDSDIKLNRIDYHASDGQEIFLQFVDQKQRVYGFLRLRLNSPQTKPIFSALKNTAIIRELHVYGLSTPLNEKGDIQHLGLGKKLVAAAEKISKQELNVHRIVVISGIGVREYYRHLGYTLDQTYMAKDL